MKTIKPILFLTILFVGISSTARGAEPMDALKGPIEKVVGILRDPQYKEAQKDVQRAKLWDLIQGVFDFTEISKRTLARNWKKFSPEQRKSFTDAFAQLLGNTYLDRMQGGYKNEVVVYLDEKMVSENKYVVKTKVVREAIEIPIDYSMFKSQGEWKIYDVNIEGVSLVKNYRTQFRKILSKETPDQLIDRVKKKTAAQKAKRDEKS